jgi:hypothetical protein
LKPIGDTSSRGTRPLDLSSCNRMVGGKTPPIQHLHVMPFPVSHFGKKFSSWSRSIFQDDVRCIFLVANETGEITIASPSLALRQLACIVSDQESNRRAGILFECPGHPQIRSSILQCKPTQTAHRIAIFMFRIGLAQHETHPDCSLNFLSF